MIFFGIFLAQVTSYESRATGYEYFHLQLLLTNS
jgi:hypothetical protein